MAFDILVSFKNVDHLECVIDVAEKDHVSAKGKTSYIGTEFRPCPAHCAWQAGEMAALLPQQANKLLPDNERAVFTGNVA